MKLQKIEYLDNKKRFLDEIKNILRNCLRAAIWLKKRKIVETNV